MAKLHLISHHISLDELQKNLQRYAQTDDHLLFIGDACICVTNQTFSDYLSTIDFSISALSADCQCRGISERLAKQVQQISDEKMVELTLTYHPVISW